MAKPSAILTAVTKAQEVFWAEVAKQFPHIQSGDFPPQAQFKFDEACMTAVMAWVAINE